MAADEAYELAVRIAPEGAEETQETLEDVQDTFEETAEDAGDQANVLERFSRRWQGAMQIIVASLAVATGALLSQVPIVADLMDGLMAIVEAIALQMDQFLRPALEGVVTQFFEWAEAIGELDGPMGDFVGLLGTLATVLVGIGAIRAFAQFTGLAALFGRVAGALRPFVGLLGRLVGGRGLLALLGTRLAFLAGPIGIAIGILSTLFLAWQQNWFGIRDITEDVLADISTFIDTHFGDVIARAQETFDRIVGIVQGALNFINDEVIQPILAEVMAVWELHGAALFAEIQATWNSIRDNVIVPILNFIAAHIAGRLDWVLDKINEVLDAAEEFWAEWGDEITTVVRFAMDVISTVIGSVLDQILTGVRIFLALLRGDWEGAWDLLKGFLQRTLDRLVGIVERWGPGLVRAMRETAENAAAALLRPLERALDRAREIVDRIASLDAPAVRIPGTDITLGAGGRDAPGGGGGGGGGAPVTAPGGGGGGGRPTRTGPETAGARTPGAASPGRPSQTHPSGQPSGRTSNSRTQGGGGIGARIGRAVGGVARTVGRTLGGIGRRLGLQTGGRIASGGLAMLHAGETVVPPNARLTSEGPGAGSERGGGPRNRFADRQELVVRFEPRRFEQFLSSEINTGPANSGRSSGPQG